MQIEQIKQMAGQVSAEGIAQAIGSSAVTVGKAARYLGISLKVVLHKPALISEISQLYETHTKAELAQMYPHVCIRSVLRFADTSSKAVSWGDSDIVAACILYGLGTTKQVSAYFQARGVAVRQIRSICHRRLGIDRVRVHGISAGANREIFSWKVPKVRLPFPKEGRMGHDIVLWCDALKHLRPGVPANIVRAFASMAQFQRWLFRGKDPKACILEIMRRLEAGETDLS